MERQPEERKKISRRKFLKLFAALGLSKLLTGCDDENPWGMTEEEFSAISAETVRRRHAEETAEAAENDQTPAAAVSPSITEKSRQAEAKAVKSADRLRKKLEDKSLAINKVEIKKGEFSFKASNKGNNIRELPSTIASINGTHNAGVIVTFDRIAIITLPGENGVAKEKQIWGYHPQQPEGWSCLKQEDYDSGEIETHFSPLN